MKNSLFLVMFGFTLIYSTAVVGWYNMPGFAYSETQEDEENIYQPDRAEDGAHGAHGYQNANGQPGGNGQNGIQGQGGGHGGNGGNSDWGIGGNGGNGGDAE